MNAILDAIRRFFYPIGAAFLGRGEAAEAPLPDPDPFDQDAPQVLAGADLDYARVPALPDVPFGTGESLARELTDYLLKETH